MKEHTFILTAKKPYMEFKLNHPDSVIIIEKVTIKGMTKEQIGKLSYHSGLNLYFEFSNSECGVFTEPAFMDFISPYPYPVVDITSLVVPKENHNNTYSDRHIDNIKIELKPRKGELDENFQAVVECMINEGVIEFS